MTSVEGPPQLSVIIPTLHEVTTLPLLLGDLAAQQDVGLEILVSDGGSTDGTPEVAAAELKRLALPGTVLQGSRGRGRQLNLGAANARGQWLLFIHADSRLPGASALAEALALLQGTASPRVAGHLTLRFALPEGVATLPYRFYEIKAQLGLPGTIHGDQGFLLRAEFFRDLGGFREDLPVLEDTLLAEQIRLVGEWRLLPAAIMTSPRRFELEGFRQRQTLNALLMNFAMCGWDLPLLRVPALYRSQDSARPLHLAPLFRQIDRLLCELPWAARWRIWYRTGEFVRSNAWQLALWRMVRRHRRAGGSTELAAARVVGSFRRWFEPLTDHPPGRVVAAMLTWLWFLTQSRRDDVV